MNSTPQLAPVRETHVYKTSGAHRLEADVIGAQPGKSKPCLLWIHGGGLIFGWRKTSPRGTFLQALLDRDFVVVSIDHRLAPETKLPGIVDDVRDAWKWLADVGPQRFGIDHTRMAMGGASAGAYLSLLAGTLFDARPRALAAFWGYGDITAPWEVEPSAHYRTMELVSREDALASLSAPPVQNPAVGIDRSIFYLYCRQQGRWLQEVTGHDAGADRAWLDRYCPLRHVDENFPATVLVHGTDDTDVPHDESARLAARLAEAGVVHRFISLAGVGHGFAGASPDVAETAEQAAAEFLRANL